MINKKQNYGIIQHGNKGSMQVNIHYFPLTFMPIERRRWGGEGNEGGGGEGEERHSRIMEEEKEEGKERMKQNI